MQQQELFGQLSVANEEGTSPKLLLDGLTVAERQDLIVTIGEGKIVGRAMLHPKNGWYLDTVEFYGHTYLNLPFTVGHRREMTAQFYENPYGEKLTARF